MATFDWLVLRRPLSDRDETFACRFLLARTCLQNQRHVCNSPEDRGHTGAEHLFRANFWVMPDSFSFEVRKLDKASSDDQGDILMLHSCSTSSPGGDLVDGSPPVAHDSQSSIASV